MTLDEAKIKFPIGTKVIPIRKSIGNSLENCKMYAKYKSGEIDYLYVIKIRTLNSKPILVLSADNNNNPFGGNHYALTDVNKYGEEKKTRYLFE